MIKEIDKIIADVDILMTENLIRAFKLCDCNPKCHCCGIKIVAGTIFKLAYIKSRQYFTVSYTYDRKYKNISEEDEMLCENCTEDDLIQYKKQLWMNSATAFENRFSGYTRIHK